MPARQLKPADSVGEDPDPRYRAIVDTAVDAIVVIDERGIIAAFNPAAERLFGYPADDVIGGNINILMPQPYHGAHDGYLSQYRATGEQRIIGIGREVAGRRRDGSTFPLELSVAEWRANGERFFTGIMRDVTERKLAESQALLVNELNHRVKNTMAMVQAIVGQTLRTASSIADARPAITSRLLALAKAHDILTRENWDGAQLADIVHASVDPYLDQERFTISGPPVRMSPHLALAMAMALSELLTNAVKYGALSSDNGLVDIRWSLDGDPAEQLTLHWEERGGPVVKAPSRKGFGTRLIEGGLSREFGSAARLDYRPTGLCCTISASAPQNLNTQEDH